MRAIKKEPGKLPEVIEIENSLEALQGAVGGYIETYTLGSGWGCVICDEEGRLKEKPFCCKIQRVTFVGTVLVVGVNGDEFCDLKTAWIEQVMHSFEEGAIIDWAKSQKRVTARSIQQRWDLTYEEAMEIYDFLRMCSVIIPGGYVVEVAE